jgi:hypothetical protein
MTAMRLTKVAEARHKIKNLINRLFSESFLAQPVLKNMTLRA